MDNGKMKNKIIDVDVYRNYFNDHRLWDKIKRVAKKAGIKVVYATLVLYYLSRDESITSKEKLKIYGALGYFILPADFVPDALVGLGFTDDLAALVWALYTMSTYITPDIEQKAEQKLREWFGDYDHSQIAGLLPMRCEMKDGDADELAQQ